MAVHACLVGSDEIFRKGLELILQAEEFEIVGSFSDSYEIKNGHLPAKFLAIIDSESHEYHIETINTLLSIYPSCHIVILSKEFELESMAECFGLGAHGYISRSLESSALIASLHLAALGEKVLPSNAVNELCQRSAGSPPDAETARKAANLSPREHDVLCCLTAGYPNKVIARRLNVCDAAVKVHVNAILRKLHVQNRTQAAIWANSHGIHGTNEVSMLP